MKRTWFKVLDTTNDTYYFARVSGTYWESDCRYNQWETPAEYQVVAIKNEGFVEMPVESVVGLRFEPREFWIRYTRV